MKKVLLASLPVLATAGVMAGLTGGWNSFFRGFPVRAVAPAYEETASVAADGVAAGSGDADVVDVVEVAGDLDGILAEFILRSVDEAETRGSLAVVLQVDSSRSTISDEQLVVLAERIANAKVPVNMWVGPAGAVAKGGVGQLAGVVDDLSLAPGSELGILGAPVVHPKYLSRSFTKHYFQMREQTITSERAIEIGLARQAPTLLFFVLDLPGFRSEVDTTGSEPVRVPVSSVRFSKLPLFHKFMHTAASPPVAYLFLLMGMVLLVLEFYSAGVGIAGFVGATGFILGCYGLAAQPVRIWAIILLTVAAFGYCVDIQTCVPRVWTVIATVSLTAGSAMLFDGVWVGWPAFLAGTVGVLVAMTVGMPSIVRARFATPTIGREWMIGASGTTLEPVNPEGIVTIEDANWRARAHRSTPIPAGEPVQVEAIEGLTLIVTPLEEETS